MQHYQQYFGLKFIPFGKNTPLLLESDALLTIKQQFMSLLPNPGIGLLTGEPGVGKTALVRHLVKDINPHQYQIYYLSETQFSSCDIYRQLAISMGLVPSYRYAQLWRDIKNLINERYEHKCILPVIIIDEAQNLPHDFFQSFPSFMNFDFDSRDMMTVWFVGHPILANIMGRAANEALASRIQVRCQLSGVIDREHFSQLIQHAFKEAGCQEKLLSDSGIELIRMATQGRLRDVHRVLVCAMQLATKMGTRFFTDELLQDAIMLLKK